MLTSRSAARMATSATTPAGRAPGCAPRAGPPVRNRAGRLTRAAWALSSRSSSPPGRPRPRGRASRRGRPQIVEHVDDGDAVVGADVGPDPRVPRGDAGHVPEATREAQQRSVLLAALVGQPHQRRRRQVRDVRHHRHQLIVPVGRQGDDLGPQVPTIWRTPAKALASVPSVGVSTQVAPSKSSAAPLDPLLLEPAIGWPPTKRASATASTIDAFTPPTSVTTPVVVASARRASSATASTGVATNVTSAADRRRRRRARPAPGPCRRTRGRRRGRSRASRCGAGGGRWSPR